MLPIYPARELPIEGIKSSVLQKKIKSKNIVELIKRENLLSYINNIPEKIKVFLVLAILVWKLKKSKINIVMRNRIIYFFNIDNIYFLIFFSQKRNYENKILKVNIDFKYKNGGFLTLKWLINC